jgi:hypothetical protein
MVIISTIECSIKHFKNKKGKIWKNWLAMSNRKKDISICIYFFKKGYQPTINWVEEENDNLNANFHNISIRWASYFR